MKKRAVSMILAATFATAALTACGTAAAPAAASDSSEATAAEVEESGSGERTVVSFWYNHTGDEAATYEEAIAAYNASQDKYTVEGLSVTDDQKVIVAMSSNEAPDVIDLSSSKTIQYAGQGLLDNLDDYVAAESYDLSDFTDKSLEANRRDGNLYALPYQAYTIQMFYNKTLLQEAGFENPPETMEEMYEMAVAATKLDADGNIDVLGYPLFPYASARQELIYGFGGRWWDEDSNPTPLNQGNLDSLNMNVKFREQFGGKALDAFIGTANTNRYTEQDMFFQGKQLFRLDGSWLPTMMNNFDSETDWGITLVPGTEANPELRGTSRFETTSAGIPTMAKNKEGAWDFIKWIGGEEGERIINIGTGNLPAIKSLYDDEEFNAIPGFTEFMNALRLDKGILYPEMEDFDEYMNFVNSALDTIYAGSATPEDALAQVAEQAKNLK